MSKIVIFTGSVYTVGGEQRVVSLFANELSKKHDVIIYSMDRGIDNIFNISESVQVRRFNPYKYDILSFGLRAATHLTPKLVYDVFPKAIERAYCSDRYSAIMNSLIEDDVDVVIATAWQLSILLGKVKHYYKRCFKAIAWEHNSYEAYFDIPYFYLYQNEELFCNHVKYVDEIVVLNDDYKDKYYKKLGLNSRVIYNPKSFSSDEKGMLKNKVLFACSRIDDKQKGINLLLDSYVDFCIKNSDWNLVIAGDGPALKKYKKDVQRRELSERITFLGRINNVKDWMKKSSIFVLPSRFEGFPMSVTEAFEIGIPVVAFDIPAMQPFKEAGGAVTVDCFDTKQFAVTLNDLVNDYNRRIELGRKGIEFAEKLTVEEIMKKWDRLIEG